VLNCEATGNVKSSLYDINNQTGSKWQKPSTLWLTSTLVSVAYPINVKNKPTNQEKEKFN